MPRVELPDYLNKEEVIQSLRWHEAMIKNFFKVRPSLLEKYPDRWILWDGESVVHACDTGAEMLQHIRENNISTKHMKIDHLETNPRKMILWDSHHF